MSQIKRILSDKFYGDVRGPVLIKIFWDSDANIRVRQILFEGDGIIKFTGLQSVMITPYEVYGGDFFDSSPGIYDLGNSAWFRSMNHQHLKGCSHYRLFFYDEIIDVICQGIVIE